MFCSMLGEKSAQVSANLLLDEVDVHSGIHINLKFDDASCSALFYLIWLRACLLLMFASINKSVTCP